jgi:hypothetical protein
MRMPWGVAAPALRRLGLLRWLPTPSEACLVQKQRP